MLENPEPTVQEPLSYLRLITSYKDLKQEQKKKILKAFTVDDVTTSPVYEMLTNFEKKELKCYEIIFFVGIQQAKHYQNIFNDKDGFYKIIPHDHIAFRYEALEVLGKGAFGETCRAYDHKNHEFVAIKIIQNHCYSNEEVKKEIKILSYLKKKDNEDKMNVVHIKSCFRFRSHFCIVLELLSVSVFDLIMKNNRKGFSIEYCKMVTYFITKSLISFSQINLRHGDLKPSNILKKRGSCGIKICDFGLSDFVIRGSTPRPLLGTRFYRAPEVILGYPSGVEADAWSLGCIVAELIIGLPLFRGVDEIDQLAVIMELIGKVPHHLLILSKRRHLFFNENFEPIFHDEQGLPKYFRGCPGSKKLHSVLGDKDPEMIDFIKRLLTWDPSERMTPRGALNHPWLRRKQVNPPSGRSTSSVPRRLVRSFPVHRKAYCSSILRRFSKLKRSTENKERLLDNVKLHSTENNVSSYVIESRLNSGF